jgi:hypothetical protein
VCTSTLNFGEGKLPHQAALSFFKLTLLSFKTTTTTTTKEFMKVLSETYYNNLLLEQSIVAQSHSGVNNIRRYYQYTVC